jgi:ABC-type uncharacterized transport system substrate-binding protein
MRHFHHVAFAVAFLLTTGSAPGAAKSPERVHRIGFLTTSAVPANLAAWRQGLRELGYVEGANLAVEYRYHEGKAERISAFAVELVELRPDVIVVTAPQPTRAIHAATSTIPIVFVAVADPLGMGLVESLARPGGNVTGLTTSVPEGYGSKHLEILREFVPHMRRLAVLRNPSNAVHNWVVETDLPPYAKAAGITLHPVEARTSGEIEPAVAAAAAARTDALFVIGDPLFFVHGRQIAELAAAHRIPASYTFRETVEAGGLVSFGPSFPDLWRRAATYVDKILKGARPGDLPVEQPVRFDIVVNAKAARSIGLDPSPALLSRADEVIE